MLQHTARRIVRRFDALLRRLLGVYEFTQDERCILRLGRGRCRRAIRLADGTTLARGDPLLMIHLWNERLPPMPAGGADFAWVVRFLRAWEVSLRLLAVYWRTNPELAQVRALYGVFAVPDSAERRTHEQALRRLGFEIVYPPPTPWRRFAHFWENLYNWAILWTYNAPSLRWRRFHELVRCQLWMSRDRLTLFLQQTAARDGDIKIGAHVSGGDGQAGGS